MDRQEIREVAEAFSMRGLDRYRPFWTVIEVAFFVIGALFWIDATQGATNFREATWGSLLYSYPAALWAGVNMLCSAALVIALARPVWVLGVAIGSFIQIGHFSIISYSMMTDGDPGAGLYAVFFLGLHAWLFVESIRYDRK